METENKETFLQENNAEHEDNAKGVIRSFRMIWKERDSTQYELMEAILDRNNLNLAYKRVKENNGAAGIDGMAVSDAFLYIKKNKEKLIGKIRSGKYTPSPVKRVEIPKPDGGIRKLGIPTVIDRIIQQAINQKLTKIYEPLFEDSSYGYRPNRSAHDAIKKIVDYAREGYCYGVSLDLSKYFDTIHHGRLLSILRRNIEDERVIQLIKRYLKSGVLENGVVMETEEGSPQGGNLSPLLANIYLDEFDKEYKKRGVPCVRYADDIVLLAKSERAAQRLLKTSTEFLERKLKLIVNREKSKVVYLFSKEDFKFLGFALGKSKKRGIYIRIHPKSWKKMKSKLKMLSSRRKVQELEPALRKLRQSIVGWLNYYRLASMKKMIQELDSWLKHRIRACVWKMWKRPKTRKRELMKLGVEREVAYMAGYSNKGCWRASNFVTVKFALTSKWLELQGYYDISEGFNRVYESY